MNIKAKSIKAKNVVGRDQVLGGEVKDLEAILKWVRGRLDGRTGAASIEAESIEAENVVGRFQWIAPGAIRDLAGLRAEVAALEAELLRAPLPEAAEAGKALAEARKELEAPEPDKAEVAKKLGSAAKMLEQLSKAADSTTRLGKQLVRWTVGAAGLWEIAGRLLGG